MSKRHAILSPGIVNMLMTSGNDPAEFLKGFYEHAGDEGLRMLEEHGSVRATFEIGEPTETIAVIAQTAELPPPYKHILMLEQESDEMLFGEAETIH